HWRKACGVRAAVIATFSTRASARELVPESCLTARFFTVAPAQQRKAAMSPLIIAVRHAIAAKRAALRLWHQEPPLPAVLGKRFAQTRNQRRKSLLWPVVNCTQSEAR